MALPALDATLASSADLPRKQMLAKWLVEELGETQAPSSVLVSGLEPYLEFDPNGVYLYVGEENGKPRYEKNVDQYIYWRTDFLQWEIRAQDLLFSSDEDVASPWLVTVWQEINMTGSPVVAEIPQPSPLSNYYSLPERYLWAKIAVAAGGPKPEADYISLPKNYAWSDIYNAVAGSSGNHTDWSENVALGHIAAACRGDTANPANLATYIDWPWRYKVASIITSL